MSKAPERIWARTTSIACGSWDDYRMVESRLWSPYDSEGSVEYIRADRIEELEAKLAKVVDALDVYADPCDATESTPCGYEGNMCCRTARTTIEEITGDKYGTML